MRCPHPGVQTAKKAKNSRGSWQEGKELFRIRDNTGKWIKGYNLVMDEFQKKMREDSCHYNSGVCVVGAKKDQTKPPSPNPNYLPSHTFKTEVWDLMNEQFGLVKGEALASYCKGEWSRTDNVHSN